jgi:hypothetical protein
MCKECLEHRLLSMPPFVVVSPGDVIIFEKMRCGEREVKLVNREDRPSKYSVYCRGERIIQSVMLLELRLSALVCPSWGGGQRERAKQTDRHCGGQRF